MSDYPTLNPDGTCSRCGKLTGTSGGHYCPTPPVRRPWKCPVCDGQGHISKPPWVAGDQPTWLSSNVETHPCHACQGTGIVWSTE